MATPLMKWAGGKRQLLDELMKSVPNFSGTYYEPFFGGGALFFALKTAGKIGNSVISDTNGQLCNLYRVIQNSPESLSEELENLNFQNNAEDYYKARDSFNSDLEKKTPEHRGAILVYLNRHCYNGLFRVNSKGSFNVPFGKYSNPGMPSRDRIFELSKALHDTEILNADFGDVLNNAKPGDFAYLDPPYDPVSSTSSFTDYHTGGFGSKEQKRLAGLFKELDQEGVSLMLSNSATPFILELYSEYRIRTIGARRYINSKSDGRGEIEEAIITNF